MQINRKFTYSFYYLAIIVLFFNSCISLHYTDYGKPFDFLTSKNDYWKNNKHTSINAIDSLNKNEITFINNKTDSIEIYVNNQVIENNIDSLNDQLIVENLINENDIINESKNNSSKQTVITNTRTKANYSFFKRNNIHQNNSKRTEFPWPKKWKEAWGNFWSGFWNFFFKWLLIGIAVLALIFLLIFGIYHLIALLGGTLAAAITIIVLLLLLWIFTGIDLSFIIDFL